MISTIVVSIPQWLIGLANEGAVLSGFSTTSKFGLLASSESYTT
jgi:hypothetical protein